MANLGDANLFDGLAKGKFDKVVGCPYCKEGSATTNKTVALICHNCNEFFSVSDAVEVISVKKYVSIVGEDKKRMLDWRGNMDYAADDYQQGVAREKGASHYNARSKRILRRGR